MLNKNYELLQNNSIVGDVIIGFFDVIHNGHKKLLIDKNASIITFYEIPRKQPINDFDTRINNLLDLGFKRIYVVEQNELQLTAKSFIEKYLLKTTKVIVGSDFCLGSDFQSITKFSNLINLQLISYDTTFSTTKIKDALVNGDCEMIFNLTGEHFKISHIVNRGNRVGHILGFPTINFNYYEASLLAPGIYYSNTVINQQQYKSVSVMIKQKAVAEQNFDVLETHILDFDENLYDQLITVKIIKKINDMRKFTDMEALKNFINENIQYVKKI